MEMEYSNLEKEEYDQAHVEKEPCDCQIECEVIPSVELKELGMKDIEMIKAFFVSVFTKEPWDDDWSDEEQLHAYIVDLIGNRNSLTFGLFENDMMVGLAMGEIKHWYEGTEYFIHELCIKTDEQGRGLGSKFIVQIRKYAKSNSIKHLFY